MNFPMTQPIFQFFYWLVNTPGLGGVVLLILSLGTVLAAFSTLRWIGDGGKVNESETYSYPTPSLHEPNEQGDEP
jgi:hypothetical protein